MMDVLYYENRKLSYENSLQCFYFLTLMHRGSAPLSLLPCTGKKEKKNTLLTKKGKGLSLFALN